MKVGIERVFTVNLTREEHALRVDLSNDHHFSVTVMGNQSVTDWAHAFMTMAEMLHEYDRHKNRR